METPQQQCTGFFFWEKLLHAFPSDLFRSDGTSHGPAPGTDASKLQTPKTMAEFTPQTILEAALLTARKPLTIRDMRRLFNDEPSAKVIRGELEALQAFWRGRGMELEELADGGWRFRTAQGAMTWLSRLEEERPARYSRAAMETLAIIAYRQPVTRGDIEDIRGVTVNPAIIRQFEDRGWVETVGWRETPGRPALLGTTKTFLNDLGLKSLADLPALRETQSEEFALGEDAPDAAGQNMQESPGIGTMQLQEELTFE